MRDAEQAVFVPGEPKTSLWASWKRYVGGDQDAALVRRINARIASNWGPSPLLLHIESSCWIKPGEPRPGPWANPLNQSALNVQEGQLTARGITAQDHMGLPLCYVGRAIDPIRCARCMAAYERLVGVVCYSWGQRSHLCLVAKSIPAAKQYLIEEYYRGLLR
jgi:hypothetical protein